MLPRCTGKCRHWKWQSGGSFPGSQQRADPPRAAELAVPAAGALRLGGEVVRGRKRGVCVRGEGWGSQPGCGRPNPSCVTPGKLHVTSLDLVSSSVKWGRFLCGGSERLGDLPRGTQLLAHGSRGTSWCSPHPQSFPRPFPLSSSRPGTPTHPAVRSALAGFALGVPTGSVEGKSHTRVTCFLFIDSARHDAGHRVRV